MRQSFQDLIGDYFYSEPHYCRDVSSKNLVLDQLITSTCLLDIVLIVRELSTCFSIYHAKTNKLFITINVPKKWSKLNSERAGFSLRLLRGEQYLIITSKQDNQPWQKGLPLLIRVV